MAKLKLRTTILSKLSTLTRNEGNLVITRDGETLYFDTDTKRFKISDFIDVADDNDRLAILAPNTEKMYYVLSTNAVWRYISGTWYEVTSTEDVSDILSSLNNKADSNKAYLTDDSNGTDVVDDDYIPFYDTSASAKKKSTFSNLVAKIKTKLITDTYSGTSTTGMSGKAVKSAIDALDGNLNNTTPGASKTLTAFSQTDGKVSATFGDINISKSQINDFPTIPTVNDATLTIQKNGTNVQTFTANASSNKTANITVPTTQADLTEVRLTNEDLNDVTYPGFYYAGGGNTVTNKPTGYNNFGLVVIHNASGSQYTQVISNENGSYRRIKKADGTWTSWAEDKFTDTTYTAGTGLSLTGNEFSVDKVPIENGGTNATTRLAALKNLTNQSVATPTYVFGMTNSWATGGYVSIANLKSTIGLGKDVPSDAVFTDTKVTQTNNTANTYLPILLANSTTSPETTTVKKNTNLTANPSNGYMDVNSLRIHSNVADHSSNFARLYCANTGDRRYKLPVDKDNDSELAVVADIPTALSDLTADETHRVVTDTQISTWNSKAGSDVNVTQTLVSTNKNYPLLFSTRETSDTTASRTGTAQRNNSVFVNPSTGKITNGGNIETIKRVDSSTQDNPAEILLTSVYNDGSDKSSYAYLRAYTAKVTSGVNLVIGSGGNTFIGSGEAANNHYNVNTGTPENPVYPYRYSTSEKMFITSDNDLHIQSTGQDIANRKGILITSNHSILPDVADTATNNAGSIGTSTYKWANVYATKLNGNTIPNGSGTLALTSDIPTAASSAPGKVASSSSTGTSTNYARQDHTHGIDLATGDSNGQVKIAGTNVSVKGLGSNAYTSTSYLPLAGGTMTGDVKYTYSTADVTLANNGVSSGIKYPMFKQINDKNGNRIMMIEGLVNSDGTLGIGLNVWNYTYNGTTQTNLYKKGIKMILDKSNSMTYSVDDAANFRTAIGCANNKVTQTSTPLTTDATYRVLLSQNANDTTQTVGARKCSNLTFNPKSGILDVGIDQGGSIDTSSIKIAPYGDNGILDIGNSSNIITRITPATTATSTVDIVLPSQSGSLALQENVPSLTWKSGGSKKGTGNYKTSAPSTCSEILLVVNLNDGTTTNIYTCINIPAPIVTATATSTQRFRGGYFQSSTAGGEVSYWIWKASNVFYIAQDIVYMNGTSVASNTTCYVYYR